MIMGMDCRSCVWLCWFFTHSMELRETHDMEVFGLVMVFHFVLFITWLSVGAGLDEGVAWGV